MQIILQPVAKSGTALGRKLKTGYAIIYLSVMHYIALLFNFLFINGAYPFFYGSTTQ